MPAFVLRFQVLSFSMSQLWRQHPPFLRGDLKALFTDVGSFTSALSARVGNIIVQPVHEAWMQLRGEEAVALGLIGTRQAYVREVVLGNGRQQWVFARSVIPALSLRGPNRELTQLGKSALGSLLFSGDGQRMSLEYRELNGTHLLAHRLRQLHLPFLRGLPARRSLFHYRQKPLLVQEVLLPDLMEWQIHASETHSILD